MFGQQQVFFVWSILKGNSKHEARKVCQGKIVFVKCKKVFLGQNTQDLAVLSMSGGGEDKTKDKILNLNDKDNNVKRSWKRAPFITWYS